MGSAVPPQLACSAQLGGHGGGNLSAPGGKCRRVRPVGTACTRPFLDALSSLTDESRPGLQASTAFSRRLGRELRLTFPGWLTARARKSLYPATLSVRSRQATFLRQRLCHMDQDPQSRYAGSRWLFAIVPECRSSCQGDGVLRHLMSCPESDSDHIANAVTGHLRYCRFNIATQNTDSRIWAIHCVLCPDLR